MNHGERVFARRISGDPALGPRVFAEHCFYELNPQTAFLMNWHIEVIAAKLTAVREGNHSSGLSAGHLDRRGADRTWRRLHSDR
jgi:hypothetical protein